MNQPISFEDIRDTLQHSAVSDGAADAHGVLSGMLCMDSATDSQQWLADCLGPELASLHSASQSLLRQLFEQTRRQLVDFDFSFEPLLPGDEDSLEERAEALGEWCHGFLRGIGFTGKDSNWPGECSEILHDFLEISRLDHVASGETDATAYTELAEYVRVGVQVIHSELLVLTPRRHH